MEGTTTAVSSCVSSGSSFKANFQSILKSVQNGSKSYLNEFFESIQEMLLSKDSSPTSKFYALLLLVKATEMEDQRIYVELATFKNLLNKVFMDAQFDKDKHFSEKGDKFFSKSPTIEESIIGNNYIRLVLEALGFWSDRFGSPDKTDAGNIYYVMYISLKKIKFPNTYYYVNSKHSITPDYHLKQDFEEQEKRDQAPINIKAFMQVTSCISSGAEYKLNSKPIFDSILENSSIYCESLLNTIIEVLDSKDYPPKSKFYALYLLVQVTETRNKIFITRFAYRKTLLTKFAQTVLNDCSSKEKGEKLFPELASTPDAVIGRNYITLLIEAIKFWDSNFGSSDIDSPFNAFRTLDSSIWKFVDLPQKYFYIGQDLDPEGDAMGKSLSVFDNGSLIPEELLGQNDNRKDKSKTEIAKYQVNECTSSSEAFKKTFGSIFDYLQQESQEYIDDFLQAIDESLNSSASTPLSQFYALYLLVKTTEFEIELLISDLHKCKSLLNKLYRIAQFDRTKDEKVRGETFFSKDPTDIERYVGKIYLRLVLETLLFLHQIFGAEEKEDPGHVFTAMVSSLLHNQFSFPSDFIYIGREIDVTLANIDQNLKNLSNKSDIKPNENVSKSQKSDNKPSNGSPTQVDINAVINSLAKLNQAKINLRHLLEQNTNESAKTKEMIPSLAEEIESVYAKNVEPQIDILLKNNNPNHQKYVTDIMTEGELVDEITKEYTKFKNKQNTYLKFRNNILTLLKTDDIGASNSRLSNQNEDFSYDQNEEGQIAKKKDLFDVNNNQEIEKIQIGNNNNTEGKETKIIINSMGDNLQAHDRKMSPERQIQEPNSFYKSVNQVMHHAKTMNYTSPKYTAQLSSTFGEKSEQSKRKGRETLLSALKQIERSIVVSKAIKNAANLNELRRKQAESETEQLKIKRKLEQEIEALKKENLNLSRENDMVMKSQSLQDISKNKLKGERSPDSKIILDEYQRQVEDLEMKIEEVNNQLKEKSYEYETLKKMNQQSQEKQGKEIKRIIEENNELNNTLRTLQQEIQSKRALNEESPGKKENQMLKVRVQDLDDKNQDLSQTVETLKNENDDLENKAIYLESQYQDSSLDLAKPSPKKVQVQKTETFYGSSPINGKRANRDNSRLSYNSDINNSIQDPEFVLKYKSVPIERAKDQKGSQSFRNLNQKNENNYDKERKTQKNELNLDDKFNRRPTKESLDQNQYPNPATETGQGSASLTSQRFNRDNEIKQSPKSSDYNNVLDDSESVSKDKNFEAEIEPEEVQQPLQRLNRNNRDGFNQDRKALGSEDNQNQRNEELVPRANNNYPLQKTETVYGSAAVPLKSNKKDNPIASSKLGYDNSVEDLEFKPKNINSTNEKRTDQNDRRPSRTSNRNEVNTAKESEKISNETIKQVPSRNYRAQPLLDDDDENEEHLMTPKNNLAERNIKSDKKETMSSVKKRKEEEVHKNVVGINNVLLFENLGKKLGKDNNLLNYKMSCLKKKSVFFDDEILQVGITSTLLPDNSSQRKILKLVLYYATKTKKPVDNFTISSEKGTNIIFALNPQKIESKLVPNKQFKQQVVCAIEKVPFECPSLVSTIQFQQKVNKILMPLPCLITKFMEFKYTDTQSFKGKWDMKGKEIVKSKLIQLNQNIIKSGYDFKNYFDYLVDLKPMDEYAFIQNKATLNFGGVFELDVLDLEYLLEIRVFPSMKATFQIAVNENDSKTAKFILDTLEFLFQS